MIQRLQGYKSRDKNLNSKQSLNSKQHIRHVHEQNIQFISPALSGCFYLNRPVEGESQRTEPPFCLGPCTKVRRFYSRSFPRSFSFFNSVPRLQFAYKFNASRDQHSILLNNYPCKKFFIKKERSQTIYTIKIYTMLTPKLTIAVLLVVNNGIYQNLNYSIRSCFQNYSKSRTTSAKAKILIIRFSNWRSSQHFSPQWEKTEFPWSSLPFCSARSQLC